MSPPSPREVSRGWAHTRLTELLGIRYPIVQAPMASISTAPLVSAVSESGALGSLGSALLRSSELEAHVARVREHTERPFAVNFYIHEEPRRDRVALARMRERLAPYRRELDAGELGAEDPPAEPRPFDAAMLEQVLRLRPAVVSVRCSGHAPSYPDHERAVGAPGAGDLEPFHPGDGERGGARARLPPAAVAHGSVGAGRDDAG